ncbi:hypothetical protein N9H39_12210, partial [Gammaproteobacteria bacterium]|nr:hypothetical protein [Gammaproteobacteria bacterium]
LIESDRPISGIRLSDKTHNLRTRKIICSSRPTTQNRVTLVCIDRAFCAQPVMNRVNERFLMELNLGFLFRYPTVSELAGEITKAHGDAPPRVQIHDILLRPTEQPG